MLPCVLTVLLCAQPGLRAGAASIDITPPVGFAMWGYGARHDAPSVGVLDSLHARALYLELGAERIAIVSLDLGRAPTRQSTATIRTRTKTEAGIEHLFLVASHTHHGPVVELDNWPDREHAYVRELERKIAQTIVDAARAARPARFGLASKDVAFNRNRQSRREDRPVDRKLVVLRVEDTDGKVIAHAVNFAAHATLTDPHDLRFSADYPGALAELIERRTGAPCLFLQGAAGDLSADPRPGQGPREFGHALGKEALALARTIQCAPAPTSSLQVREDDFHFESRVDFGNLLVQMGFVRAFFPDLVAFYVREYREGIRPHLTTALLDGRLGIVGVSGEFFCGHALSLRQRARLDDVLFLGYCNDYQQYFPTIAAAAEGGYGADPQLAPAEPGAGERMIDRALVQLYRMRGKLPNLPPTPR
jgi:hypothetical protein